MTVEEILERKRELLAQRAQTENAFELSLLNEELGDLNAQLRSLHGGGAKAQRSTSNALVMNIAQYKDWMAADRDDEMHEAHQIYIDAVKGSAEVLTEQQKKIFDMWQGGMRVIDISAALDLDKSTVSRTLMRAKVKLREEAERLTKKLKLADATVFDLADPDVARVILSCLTAHQAVCIYLYYGEWLNLRDCGELLGIDHTAVLRTVQRGLRAIADTTNLEAFALDNADALSDLAYELFLEQGGNMDVLQKPEKHRDGWARKRMKYARGKWKPIRVPLCTVRTSDGLTSERGTAHDSLMRPMSKMLTLLFELRTKGTLFRWLNGIFAKITKKQTRGNQNVAVR